MRRILAALCLLALFVGCGGCGGGGGATVAPSFQPEPVDLGLVPSNAPTTFAVLAQNPYADDATLSLQTLSAGLTTTAALPRVLAPGERVMLDITLAPATSGTYAGSVRLRVEGGGQASDQQTRVLAIAETARAGVTPAALDFGSVVTGAAADRFATFTNTSLVSAVRISGATSPDPAYALVSPALPRVVAPGESVDLRVRYSPTTTDTPEGNLTLLCDAADSPLSILLQASTGGQEIVTFDDVAFDAGGDTRELTFSVPSDAIAFTIEATANGRADMGLRLLLGPGATEYENEALTGAYIWSLQSDLFTTQVPNTDRFDVQLVPGGGTYRTKLMRWTGTAPSCDVHVIIERRPDAATRALATLDLNVFLAAGIAPTAATAATDSTLQTVLTEIDGILGQQGIRLGDVDYYDVTDARYDDVTWAEFGPMLELSAVAQKPRLNLFFVRTAIGGGILGVSPALGGPSVNGTPLSGVMSLYSPSNPSFIGLVAAHEIGHYLGLAHTVEQTGEHDDIVDTDDCPASGTSALCRTTGGGYLMHWQAVGGTTVTNGQGLVARGHPHMAARAGASALETKPSAPRTIEVPEGVGAQWCGTCQCLHPTRVK